MNAKEAMNTNVKTIQPSSNIKRAAEQMTKYRIGSLIVVKSGKLVGIVTERDILQKVVAKNKNTVKTKVSDIMTKEVMLISPDLDIESASKIMKKHKIKKLPVIIDHHLVGILTATDIVSAQLELMDRLGHLFLGANRKKLTAG
ncbi:MAG: CBS domain-containing protein [Candidatus Aenigmarchaeota archaeon]|nr:CBS domain-containing protein [Candidatus Aenigmarchaeota archaeon]